MSARRSAFDRDAYEADAEALHAELAEARHARLMNVSAQVAMEPIYERHAALFERGTLDALRARVDADGDELELERDRALLAFATDGYLQRAVAGISDELHQARANAVVVWRGESIGFPALIERISTISSRAERNGLFASYLEAEEQMNGLRWRRHQQVVALAADLGYADMVELVRVTRGYDPDALGAELREFLSGSETEYYAALRRYLAQIEIEQGDASTADAWHLLRGSNWDHFFDARRMLAMLPETLGRMGIDLTGRPGTQLMAAPPDRPGRTAATAVRAPTDVRLVIQLASGWAEFSTALHEAARLQHFAAVNRRLPFPLRALGDAGVREGYAALFARLVGDPAWLVDVLSVPERDAAAFSDFFALVWLWRMRNAAARHLYELRLYRGSGSAVARAEYAGLVGLLTGIQEAEERFLLGAETPFAAADEARAAVLAGAVEERLQLDHGLTWWQDPAAGAELGAAWREGTSVSVERALARLGYDARDWRPGLRRIRAQLIGEMSGYGGPNITTRAGTRKV